MRNWCPKCGKFVEAYSHKIRDSMKAKHNLKVCPGCSLILVDRIVKKWQAGN